MRRLYQYSVENLKQYIGSQAYQLEISTQMVNLILQFSVRLTEVSKRVQFSCILCTLLVCIMDVELLRWKLPCTLISHSEYLHAGKNINRKGICVSCCIYQFFSEFKTWMRVWWYCTRSFCESGREKQVRFWFLHAQFAIECNRHIHRVYSKNELRSFIILGKSNFTSSFFEIHETLTLDCIA